MMRPAAALVFVYIPIGEDNCFMLLQLAISGTDTGMRTQLYSTMNLLDLLYSAGLSVSACLHSRDTLGKRCKSE